MTENEAIRMFEERLRLDVVEYAPEYAKAMKSAISALKEIQQYKDNRLCLIPEDVYSRQCSELDAYKEIGTVEECREAVKRQKPKKPVWKNGSSIICKDYADGRGEITKEKWADWTCPNCDWFVGEQYIPRHRNLRKSNYCAKCGQAIQWDENLEGMEDERD